MSADEFAGTLRQALIALGALFVIVNLRVSYELAAWWRLRRDVMLTWPSPKPPFFAINLAIGIMLGAILLLTAYRMPRSYSSLFGVAMMFTYYGYLLPLSARIKPGLYRDGIWTDSGFMSYREIGGLTWKSGGTLILASRQKTLARQLTVPGPHLGEVRHLLREEIGRHTIAFDEGPGVHLGSRDTRESA
ncbi:MAG: hypothetical protein CK533_00995 [Acidobacterium sp.]|nr:hypothetical protein [Acidobacteriota bacterium]PHY12294.1 MAG: hypothetical protein CK533_00995 [Acidobacterium sp.]